MRYLIETAWDGRHPDARDPDVRTILVEVSKPVFLGLKERLEKFGEDWREHQTENITAMVTSETAEELRVASDAMVLHAVLDN